MKRLSGVGLVAAVLVLFVGTTRAGPAGGAPALADKVAKFCKAHLGRKVATGQCSALAWDALKAAGAEPRLYPDSPGKGDYVWGKQVYSLKAGPAGQQATGPLRKVEPGYVIQFHQTKGPGWNCPHHTAVVASIDVKARTLTVYEQNVGGKMFVVESRAAFDDLKAGWIRVYRPVKAKE